MPVLYVIAGPNGVGKTTFINEYLPKEIKQLEFVNADLIARGLSPFDPDRVSMEAGRIALERIRELIQQRVGFTWETTMSGRTAVGWLRGARDAGYTLKTYFLWVSSPSTTIARVQKRVIEGGHNIPEDVSRRRFYKTIQNFFTIYRPLMHSWKLLENDKRPPRLIAVEKSGRLVARNPKQLSSILDEIGVEL
jgi:predicted ABC-type ATPase